MPRFLYAVNSYYSAVSGFVIDNDHGQLIPNGYVFAEHFPSAIAVHPSGEYVVVASQSTAKLLVYKANKKTGRLTIMEKAGIDSGVMSPFSMLFHPSGRFIYIAGRMSMNVTGFRFDQQTGQLNAIRGLPIPAERRPRQISISPNGQFLYVVNVYSHNVSGYKINQDNGELTELQGSPFPTSEAPIVMMYPLMDIDVELGAAPHNITFHPSGKFLYVANWMSSSISAYSVNEATGALKQLENGPFLTEPHPYDLIVDPAGDYLYTANWVVDKLTGFRIDQATGELHKIEDIPLRDMSFSVTQMWFNQTGEKLFIACYNSHSIEIYDKNPATGRLTPSALSSVVSGPRDFDVVSGEQPVQFSSRFLFGLSEFENSVLSFKLNRENGNLDQVTKLAIESKPISLAIDNVNNRLYVVAVKPDILYAYPIHPQSGEIMRSREIKLELKETPSHVSVDVNGRFIYVSSGKSNRMSIFSFHAETGKVAEWPESPRSTGNNATIVESEPVGRFALLINNDDQTIYPYRYTQIMGPATTDITPPEQTAVTGTQPSKIAFDPYGNYAYISNSLSDNISAYWIHRQTGELKELKRSPFKAAIRPVDIVVHPNGLFAFVLSAGNESITTYDVDRSNGVLTATKLNVSTESLPLKMVIDAAGSRLYVVYKDRKAVSQYLINANNGQLTRKNNIQLELTISDLVADTYIQ